MAGRDTTAAVESAWQRPMVPAQTERAARAFTDAKRARLARRRTMALVDQRVANRDDAACIETARLVWTCGSVETAAALLGLDPDRVRRAMVCRRRRRHGPTGTRAPVVG